MKVGDLCKVVSPRSHSRSHAGDLIMITKTQLNRSWTWAEGPVYVKALNFRTKKFQHYKKSELEVISEIR